MSGMEFRLDPLEEFLTFKYLENILLDKTLAFFIALFLIFLVIMVLGWFHFKLTRFSVPMTFLTRISEIRPGQEIFH